MPMEKVYWNGGKVDRGQLNRRIRVAAQLLPVPELHLRAGRKVAYERVAQG